MFGSCISGHGLSVQHRDHIVINSWWCFLALGLQQPLCICSLCYISALATRHSEQLNLSFGWIYLLHQLDLIDHPVKWTWGGAILLMGGQQVWGAQPLCAGTFMWQKSLYRPELHSALGLHSPHSSAVNHFLVALGFRFSPFFFFHFRTHWPGAFFPWLSLNNDDHSKCCYYILWFSQVLRDSEGIPWCEIYPCLTFSWTGPLAELWLFQASSPELELCWQHSCSLSAGHRWQFISIILQS